MRKLSIMQARFAMEYIQHGNGKQAAICAGYSDRSAEVKASKLLRNRVVQDEIARLRAELEKQALMNAEDAHRILDIIIRANLGDYFDDAGQPKSLNELTYKQRLALEDLTAFTSERSGGTQTVMGVNVKLYSKLKALDMKFKLLGAYRQSAPADDPYMNYLEAIRKQRERTKENFY